MSELDNHSEEPSKSQINKAMKDLQKIGEALVKLAESHLAKVEMPEMLAKAVYMARTLKDNEAKRRQMQYIGKIMRNIDVAPIKLALLKIQLNHDTQTKEFHDIEEWRDKLILGTDETIQHFLAAYPACDRQQLRQLVRKAQHDHKNDKNTGGKKALFKFIHEILQVANKE